MGTYFYKLDTPRYHVNWRERIIIDLNVMAGKPVIKGTRIPVDAILRRLGEGASIEEILEDYPNLKEEDIRAALIYAAESLAEEEIIPLVGSH